MSDAVGAPLWKRLLPAGIVLIAANGVLGLLPLGAAGETAAYVIFGAFMLASVGLLVSVTLRFEQGSPVRRQWGLIAIGVALGVVGDIVYVIQSTVTSASPPFPSWATPAYFIQYVFLLAGMVLAARAYRMVVSIRQHALVAFGSSALLTAALLWFEVTVVFRTVTGSMRSETVFFTVSDMMLMFAPAVLVVLVIRAVGGANLSRPWIAVAIAAALFSVGDIANLAMGAFGGEVDLSFALVGMSRMASAFVFGLAALMARDAFALRA